MFNFSSFAGLLTFLLLALRLPAAAQAPAWQSAQAVAVATAAAAGNYSEVTATAVDAAGNVFLTGSFSNSVVLGGTTLTSLGSSDVFIAKFSPASNQFVWAQRAGGTNSDNAAALAVSGTSVYVAGVFYSAVAGFGATTLTNAGLSDVFVAKLTDAGTFVWAQRAGGVEYDTATALSVSGTSVYVAGGFSATAGFGATTLTDVGVVLKIDIFIAKLTDTGSTGSFVWAKRAGGTYRDIATALAVSGTSVYVTGVFTSAVAAFGPTTLTNTSASGGNVFVARLTDAGTFVWAQQAGGTGYNYASGLAVSGTSVYVAGSFGSFGASFGATILTNAGSYDIFVAKLTDAGTFVWAQRAGGTGDEGATVLAVSGNSVYLAGNFSSTSASFGTSTLTNVGGRDLFVAKLTDAGPTGSFVWAQRAGSIARDYASTLAVSGTSVYVAGSFGSLAASFGPITLANSTNDFIGFLASLTDPTLTSTTAGQPREPAQLFPNPARRTATLRRPAGTPAAPLTLTDATGRAVRRYPAPAGLEVPLDLGGLPAGLYLLRGAGAALRLAVE